MKLPRDLSGDALVRALKVFGYRVVRQSGSHVRLSAMDGGEHHLTVPRHEILKAGTLSAILAELSRHHRVERDQLLSRLFG